MIFFSTGTGEGTGHHPNSVMTVAGVNNNMEMYKMIKRASAAFNWTLQTQHLLPNMLTELNVELALEDACVIDDIILLVVRR